MQTDHRTNNQQQSPVLTYVLAPLFAPLIWFVAGLIKDASGRGLGVAVLSFKALFMLSLCLGSYAVCIPLLGILETLLPALNKKIHGNTLFATVFITTTTAVAGLIYAQAAFQDASIFTRNMFYLGIMLLICLGMFISLKGIFTTSNHCHFAARFTWTSRIQNRWGISGMLHGIVSIVMISIVTYLQSINFHADVLKFFFKKDLHEIYPEEIFRASVFDVSPNAIVDWCFYAAIILALAAIASALAAKIRNENSLYRAAACVFGGLAFAIVDPRLAVYAMLFYGITMYALQFKVR
ncbi:hypothetical protein ACO0LM_04600 [Undibacterium sp. Di26W]|uniref:hypothetical protein n=1 Tax=Undibacterium sp. Di26W TaxID=3413035 RepID=UPI003BF1935E